MEKSPILVIDDELQIRRLLEITLESNNFNVESAGSAKEGLRMAASHPPDLIILDLGLPDENGHAVLKKLREWYTRPILAEPEVGCPRSSGFVATPALYSPLPLSP